MSHNADDREPTTWEILRPLIVLMLCVIGLSVLVLLFAGCKAPPRRPAAVQPPTLPRLEFAAPEAVLPPPPPAKTNVVLTWDYHLPMPHPRIVFEVWSTPRLGQWYNRREAVVTAPPVVLPIIPAENRFFDCRASNIVTGEVSGWSTK